MKYTKHTHIYIPASEANLLIYLDPLKFFANSFFKNAYLPDLMRMIDNVPREFKDFLSLSSLPFLEFDSSFLRSQRSLHLPPWDQTWPNSPI